VPAADPFPVNVDLLRAENVLEIEWDDGARTRYTGGTLRWACPCATCRGEAGAPGRLDLARELSEPELRLTEVSLVGRYALRIGFASGHDTGIFTFPSLRSLGEGEGGGGR
jgi:DUF971 family protein